MSLLVSQSDAHLSERDEDFQVNLKMLPRYVYSCQWTLAPAIKLPPYNMQMSSPQSLKDTILKIHVHFHGDKLAQPEPACFRMWTHTILLILLQPRFFSHRIVQRLLSYRLYLITPEMSIGFTLPFTVICLVQRWASMKLKLLSSVIHCEPQS